MSHESEPLILLLDLTNSHTISNFYYIASLGYAMPCHMCDIAISRSKICSLKHLESTIIPKYKIGLLWSLEEKYQLYKLTRYCFPSNQPQFLHVVSIVIVGVV